ncbi:MAG: hypothetical protein EOM20_13300 [Spartobacteria bacterium]|nr:hypothetical protein [Spartobacteria bacterium]
MKITVLTLACLLCLFLGAGCEPDDDDKRGEIEITPAVVVLAENEKSVVLTAVVSAEGNAAAPNVYPLTWSVTEPDVGVIVVESANKAVYTHAAKDSGGNIIMVRDRLAREGLATVYWNPE